MATPSTSPRAWKAWPTPAAYASRRPCKSMVRDRLALPFEDGGEQSVKNIARPIRVYAVSADALAALPKAEAPATLRPTRPLFRPRNIAAVALTGVLIVATGLWWLWPLLKAPSATATAPT